MQVTTDSSYGVSTHMDSLFTILVVREGRSQAQVIMGGYEPRRLDLGDVRSQRGGKEKQRAPEDTNTFLFFRCSCTTMVELLQHI